MTTCTCDTHWVANNSTVLTVQQASSSSTALSVVYSSTANGAQAYNIFAEGGANAILGKTYTNSGRGVLGQASCTSGGYGVHGQAAALDGRGVFGEATYSTNNNSGYGVYGLSNGFVGVYGISSSVSGTSVGYGVMGWGLVGVYAGTTGGPNALYVNGGGNVSGYLTKSGGGFRVDHPSDPENKYLNHCFVESPEMMNIYRGRVTLDKNGEATATLPGYFEAANESPEYTLTSIGAAMPNLHVSEEIKNGSFKISGGVAGKSVSWLISSARADAWAKANHPGVEIEKSSEEKGFFRHPEVHGFDHSKSVDPITRNGVK